MKIIRRKIISKEWVIEINHFVMPVSLIKSCVLFLTLCALFVYAYNLGQVAATNQVEYAAYMCTEGCRAIAEGGRIVWECAETTIDFNTTAHKP